MKKIKQAVILAGGLGTRLRPLTESIPKPMIRVNNRPFLEYLIEMVKENGITDVLLLLGYLPEKIREHFKDGSKFGVTIRYSITDVSDDTGTRIKHALPLMDDIFLLMYCDNYWPMNLKKLYTFYVDHGTDAMVTVYTNKDGVTQNNMLVNDKGYVLKYDKSRQDKNLNGVEIGFFILRKKLLKSLPNYNFSFEKEVIPSLIAARQLSGYQTDHRYYSISTPERVKATEKFLQPKKIIFLDRDGVINKKPPKADYVKRWEEFKFLPGSIEALALLSKKNYEMYLITNQSGIARGMMSEDDLQTIHTHLKRELAKNKITINGIYACLHGWDEGCECRKPKPGLLFQAARDHYLDLTKTIFIGDDERDGEAGERAGCKTILLKPNESLLDVVKRII